MKLYKMQKFFKLFILRIQYLDLADKSLFPLSKIKT